MVLRPIAMASKPGGLWGQTPGPPWALRFWRQSKSAGADALLSEALLQLAPATPVATTR